LTDGFRRNTNLDLASASRHFPTDDQT